MNMKLLLQACSKKHRDVKNDDILPFYDYIPALTKELQKKPKTIIEWGSGLSTMMMSVHCPKSKIVTIEHSFIFYLYNLFRFVPFPNIVLKYRPRQKGYTFLDDNYDLAFVDGRWRNECLKNASKYCKRVLLHDANRQEYAEGIGAFNKSKTNGRTALLHN